MIDALVASRIPIQFVGQIATVFYLRSKLKERSTTFRMPLFPLPALVALAGWVFIFVTSGREVILYSFLSLVAGFDRFLLLECGCPEIWSYDRRTTAM